MLSDLIPTLQQDPKPATELIQTLIRPESVAFTTILSINPPVNFEDGLSSPNVDINMVTLSLIGKACAKPWDAGMIAASLDDVPALIRLWLCTPHTEVARKGLKVLTGLLRIDISSSLKDESHLAGPGLKRRGQGMMWKRVFQDRDVYELFFSICSLTTTGQPGQPSKREKTISQSRLLDFVLIYQNFEQITSSQLPDIEAKYGVHNGGLLDFVAIHMVDYENDMLMHATLMDFFANYLCGNTTDLWSDIDDAKAESTEALQFLVSRGLHSRTMSYFLEPRKHNSWDLSYVYPQSAEYIAAYASRCPSNFMRSTDDDATKVLQRLHTVFSQWPSSHWGQAKAPTSELHILASLPRRTLLSNWDASPLLHIPMSPANANAYNTLAAIFQGPQFDTNIHSDKSFPDEREEAAAARALYHYYLKSDPQFWPQLITAAETVALKDTALAAISLLCALVSAKWDYIPSDPSDPSDPSSAASSSSLSSSSSSPTTLRPIIPFTLPTEADLERHTGFNRSQLAPSGAVALLCGPSQTAIIPYISQPAQIYGKGDAQSAGYHVAVAKYEMVVHFDRELKRAATVPEWERWLAPVKGYVAEIARCVARGVWGGVVGVGGQIGTMER